MLAELNAARVAAVQDAIVQALQAQPAAEDDEAPAGACLARIRLLRSYLLSSKSWKQRWARSSPWSTALSAVLVEWNHRIASLSLPDCRGPGCAAGQALLEHFVASRALRRLLLRGKGCSPDAKQAQTFADKLWSKRLQGHCNQLVAGHAAKVSCQHPPTCTQPFVKYCHADLVTLCSCCTTIAQYSQ